MAKPFDDPWDQLSPDDRKTCLDVFKIAREGSTSLNTRAAQLAGFSAVAIGLTLNLTRVWFEQPGDSEIPTDLMKLLLVVAVVAFAFSAAIAARALRPGEPESTIELVIEGKETPRAVIGRQEKRNQEKATAIRTGLQGVGIGVIVRRTQITGHLVEQVDHAI